MKKKAILTSVLVSAMTLSAAARDASDITVYINPGHGGHDSNDRNVVIPPYAQGDPNGYWESNSNLTKGLFLRDMLQAKGYKVVMSRVTNTTDDDLPLSTIVNLANASKADVYFSIHSNATGTSSRRNAPLMLFRGFDNEPENPEAYKVCEILNKELLDNKATYWTNTNLNIRGDWSFYNWGAGVGLGALRGLKVTGMLSEGSFHDYIPETYRLMSDDYCWLEAWHFRRTVDQYFGIPGVSTGVVCGLVRDNRVPREGLDIYLGTDKLATVQNAKVELKDASGKVVDTYTTHAVHKNGFYLFKNVAPGEYTVAVSCETHQPDVQAVTVTADKASYANFNLGLVRNTPPTVESYSPVWKEGDASVLCNSPIIFQFNWDMDIESTEKAFKINPAVEGTFTWEDLNHRMIFTPTQAYDISTTYTVTLEKSAMHGGMTPMEKDFTFSFFTSDRNFMDILGHFPREGENVHFANAAIEFRFDKYPNVTPLLKQVKCVDSKGEAVSFDKRGKTNSSKGDPYGYFRIPFLKDLTVGETYTLTLDGAFADKDGLTIQAPVTVQFTATDEGAAKPETDLVDNMNDASTYTFAENGSTSVTSASVAANAPAKSLFDGATAFTYQFDSFEGGEVLFERNAKTELAVAGDQQLGVHVMGDLSDNELYLEFITDISTQYVKVCDLDFLGWRYISVNAQLESPGQLSGIKLVQKASQRSPKGTFAIDDILVGASGGVDGVTVSSLTLHPNPASEYLVANADCTIAGLKLYDINGRLVAAAQGNVLNVSELPEGNYIAVVETASTRSSHHIVVKH